MNSTDWHLQFCQLALAKSRIKAGNPNQILLDNLLSFGGWLHPCLDGDTLRLVPMNLKTREKLTTSRKFKVQTFVLGLRPVANIMCENPSSVPLLVFRDNEPSADLTIA